MQGYKITRHPNGNQKPTNLEFFKMSARYQTLDDHRFS